MSNLIERVLQTNIYLQPIHFLLAISTNILNIRILSCRALRSSLCTHYFLAYAVVSIAYTCILCPVQFARGFSINLAHGKIACKLHAFSLFVLPFQANIMLVLASFDRYCSSSHLSHLQSVSVTLRQARRNISIGILLSLFYMLPMLLIYHWDEYSRKCRPKSHLLITIYISSQIITYYLLSPLLMLLFGVLTIHHIHQQSKRFTPLIIQIRRRRTEFQLARMLFCQVTIHLILVVPFGILYALNAFVPSTLTPTIIAIRLAFVTWQQCNCFVSFFLYVLSAHVYRQQFIRILRSCKCSHTENQRCCQDRIVQYHEPIMRTINIRPTASAKDIVFV